MRRERIVKIFTGSAEDVERKVNDFLAEPGVTLGRVHVRHWGVDPVSLMVLVERDPDDPDVKRYNRMLAESLVARDLGLS